MLPQYIELFRTCLLLLSRAILALKAQLMPVLGVGTLTPLILRSIVTFVFKFVKVKKRPVFSEGPRSESILKSRIS